MNAHHIAQEQQQDAAFAGAIDDADYWYSHPTNLYTSSVEMVTSPESYPLWKTKQPVIVVVHNSHSAIQHHYYRYLVVTPGTSAQETGVSASTGNDALGTTNEIMMWEQPFGPITGPVVSSQSFGGKSMQSDDDSHNLWHLAHLPYRTLDINVETGQVVSPSPEDRRDTWNYPEDASYRGYQIRESMSLPSNEQAARLFQRSSQSTLSDDLMQDDEDDVLVDGKGRKLASNKNTAPKILFICFHLPVVVVKVQGQWHATWSESLLAQKEGSKIVATYRAHWIGTVTPHPPIVNDEDRQEVRRVLSELNCTPIFLNPSTRQAHYYGFCKQVLWPAFHNIDLLDLSTSSGIGTTGGTSAASSNHAASDWDQSRLDHWWQAYQEVNQEFANVVNGLVDRDSSTYLWIHDYHLSLLPRCLNQEPARSCRKVFFLHIPFPTSQIFRELECGEDILTGMLHADVVGFHAFDHARHFLNAAKRILGLNYESLVGGLIGVNYLSKTVLVSMSNVSIEPKMADGKCRLLDTSSSTHSLI
jgi:trehalose 6-phosphate synthase/phosphatase